MRKIISLVILSSVICMSEAAPYRFCPESISCYVDPIKGTAKHCTVVPSWQFYYYSGASGINPGTYRFGFGFAEIQPDGSAYCHFITSMQIVLYQSVRPIQPATKLPENLWSPLDWKPGKKAYCIPESLGEPGFCPWKPGL